MGTRLPSVDQGQYQTPRPTRGVASYRAGDAERAAEQSAAGTAEAAKSLFKFGSELLDADDKKRTAEAKSSFLRAKVEADNAFDQDQDWATYEKRYGEKVEAAKQQARGLLRTDAQRAAFDADADLDIIRGSAAIKDKAWKGEVDSNLGQLGQIISGNREFALRATDEADRAGFLSATQEAIAAAKAKGYLSEVKAGELGRKSAEDYAEGYLLTRSPKEQMDLLRVDGNGRATLEKTGTLVDYIPAERRAQIALQAHNTVQREGAAAKREYLEGYKDYSAWLRAGNSPRPGDQYSPAKLTGILGPEDGARATADLQRSQQVGAAMQAVEWASPEQLGKIASTFEIKGPADFRDRAQDASAFAQALQHRNKLLADNPAAYVARSPAIQRDYDAMQGALANPLAPPQDRTAAVERYANATLSEQTRLGVPTFRQQLLPDPKSDVARIGNMDPEAAADSFQQMSEQYGKYWPDAYRDLVKAKLPPEYRVLATVDAAVPRKQLAEALKLETQSPGSLRKSAGQNAKVIDDAVNAEMAGFKMSLADAPDGARVGSDTEDAARLLAYKYTATLDPSEAARKAAADLVNSRYVFVQDDRHNARVPPPLARAAEDTAARILGGLKADEMPDPGGNANLSDTRRREIALSAAKRGLWVTNETDDGWLLLDINRQPVTKADGSRVEFKFGDASPELWRPEGVNQERNLTTGELVPKRANR